MDSLWQFFNGTTKLKITGTTPERFINLCLINKISLWDIKRIGEKTLIVHTNVKDVKKLRPLLRKSFCRMHILKKYGLPFLWIKAFRRKAFLVGGSIFCLTLYIMSTFIWTVDIFAPKPLKNISKQVLLDRARAYGLKPGVSKILLDPELLKPMLLKDFPNASWIGIDISGTKAIITIYERIEKPKEESSAPADLIAEKDAVVEDIFVIEGTPLVTKGLTVEKGDTLISAKVYPPVVEGQETPSGEMKYVRAKGIVRARTWYEARARVLLKEKYFYKSGNSSYGLTVKFPDGTIKNWSMKKFPAYEKIDIGDWRNSRFAVELKMQKYNEILSKKIIRKPNEAKAEANLLVDKKLRKLLSSSAKLVKKNYLWYNNMNSVTIRGIWEVNEQIGLNR